MLFCMLIIEPVVQSRDCYLGEGLIIGHTNACQLNYVTIRSFITITAQICAYMKDSDNFLPTSFRGGKYSMIANHLASLIIIYIVDLWW